MVFLFDLIRRELDQPMMIHDVHAKHDVNMNILKNPTTETHEKTINQLKSQIAPQPNEQVLHISNEIHEKQPMKKVANHIESLEDIDCALPATLIQKPEIDVTTIETLSVETKVTLQYPRDLITHNDCNFNSKLIAIFTLIH